jgi:hypothetical protein
MPTFVARQLTSMIRMYAMYQPLRVFFYLGLIVSIVGLIPVIRFLFFYFIGNGEGHLQSLVLGGVLLIIGFVTFMIGLVADLISFNRQLTEITLEKVRRIELERLSENQKP